MNGYARLSFVKGSLSLNDVATQDDEIVRVGEEISRDFDGRTGRFFFSEYGTRYFGVRRANQPKLKLNNPADLISIESISVDVDADQSYRVTLTEDDDYWLEPFSPPAYRAYRSVRLNPNSTQLTTWPVGARTVRITGMFGYTDEWEETGVTAAEALDASETGIDLSAGALIDQGETIEIDAEQIYVAGTTTDSPYTLTVVRGINGTTAATHSNGATILRRRYDRRVEQAVRDRLIGYRWDTQTGNQGAMDIPGQASGKSYAKWMQSITDLRLPVVA